MTTWRMVSERVAPRPRLPSRIACGTALMMSSDNDDTNGISMMPITTPAVSTEEPDAPRSSGLASQSRIIGPTVISAKRP